MAEALEVQDHKAEIITTPIIESLARAEIDIQIATARAYPRSLVAFKKKALDMACLDRETAESCLYSVPREGKMISGPSVRLAEIVANCYQHIRSAARVVEVGETFVVAQGVCHDLENNTSASVEVRRRITKSNGKRYSDDMITTTSNAACAIAYRNAVYKVVPAALCKPIFEEAKRVAVGDVKSLADRRDKAMKTLGNMGATPDRIFTALGVNGLEEIGQEEMATLLGLYQALKSGETSLEEAFPPTAPPEPGRHKMGFSSTPKGNGTPKTTTAKPGKAPDRAAGELSGEEIDALMAGSGEATTTATAVAEREPGEEG